LITIISRRNCLLSAALSAAAVRPRAQRKKTIQVALAIPDVATGPRMPDDFIGLSYEVQQLTDPLFFSAQNTGLMRAFK